MRIIKMLGLAVVFVLAAMAFVGGSSAMAESALACQNEVGECVPVEHGHFLSVALNAEGKYVDGKGKLLAGSNTIECAVLALGDVQKPFLGSPVKVVGTATFTSCNLGCSVATPGGASEIPGTIDVLRLGAEELADVTGLGIEIKLNCPFIFTCDYNGEGLVGHGLRVNGEAGGLMHVTATEASINLTNKLSGPFNCPSTSALDALGASLSSFYVRS